MSEADPLIGTELLGRYTITRVVGAGAMGTVYGAGQANVDREVAVKFLAGEAARDEQVVQRFQREAKVLAKLQHPNSLTLLDTGTTEEGRIFIVTELLHGSPLDELLKEKGPLDLPKTVQVMSQTCEALQEAHDHGIVHRDLKPGNLFLVRVGRQEIIKVLDFGIARLLEDNTKTAAGTVLGTAAYMSPQQAQGMPVDHRSDLYSLGAIAYQCLTGEMPFSADTVVGMLMKHVSEPPMPFSQLDPPVHIPQALDDLIMKLLEKDPDDRPQSAADVIEMARAIDRQLHGGSPFSPVTTQPEMPQVGAVPQDVGIDETIGAEVATVPRAGVLPVQAPPSTQTVADAGPPAAVEQSSDDFGAFETMAAAPGKAPVVPESASQAGAPAPSIPSVAKQPPGALPELPTTVMGLEPLPMGAPAQQGGSKKVMIAVAAVLLLAVAGAVGFFLTRSPEPVAAVGKGDGEKAKGAAAGKDEKGKAEKPEAKEVPAAGTAKASAAAKKPPPPPADDAKEAAASKDEETPKKKASTKKKKKRRKKKRRKKKGGSPFDRRDFE